MRHLIDAVNNVGLTCGHSNTMTKRETTPYPHLQIEQLLQAEEEDEDNQVDDNTSKYRRQLNILGPKPERGRQVFASILNREWDLVNTNTHTEDTDSEVSH